MAEAVDTFDLILIGAGVNGVGMARDAALRGMRVLLLERHDLCSGTSAWATRLIHGGLRYLEFFEIGLVRESLREREILLHQAPHLVGPMPLAIPLYKGQKRGPFLIRLGMWAYDILSFDKTLPWHRMFSAAATKKRYPGLLQHSLRGAALYYDAQVTYTERLVVEAALDAAANGAILRNHTEVTEIVSERGRVTGVVARDTQTGAVYRANAPIVCNVTGPFVDIMLKATGMEFPRLMGGTKGSHIVVSHFPGVPEDGLYVEADKDGRPFFILPWNEQILIGTTDLRTDEKLDEVKASREECEYLLKETNRLFPEANLTLDKIHFTYSGVRPLPYTPKGSTAAITRRHQVLHHAPKVSGLYSIVGGKLTTYRSLSEEAVTIFLKALGRPRKSCPTRKRPLPGYTEMHRTPFMENFAKRHDLSTQTARHLTHVYGQRAEELVTKYSALKRVIDPHTGALAAEVVWAVREEMAQTLVDIVWRRTMTGWRQGLGHDFAKEALKIANQELGWDPQRCEKEWDDYLKECERFKVPK